MPEQAEKLLWAVKGGQLAEFGVVDAVRGASRSSLRGTRAMSRKIFISAVSGELKSYRLLVEQSLQKRGYTPVFQELFGLTDQQIVDVLRAQIDPCEAVICLIGHVYGAEPSTPLDGQPRRSFTQ